MTTSSHIVIAAVLFQLASVVSAFAATPSLLPAAALTPAFSALQAPDADFQAQADLSPAEARVTLAAASVSDAGVPESAAGRYSLLDPEHLLAQVKTVDRDVAAGIPKKEDQWHWRRASALEYVGVTAAAVGTVYFEIAKGEPTANWTAHNAFDEGIRDNLRLKSQVGRDVTHILGNTLMAVMIATPIVEPFAAMGLRDNHWDAFWQTEMINIESFAFTSLVSSVMQNLIARERPFVRNCSGGKCEGVQANRSMPSGHSAFAFTGAGLLCRNHRYQPLYDDPETDKAICTAGIWISVADTFLRIMADRHYMTDALAGSAIGLFSGFVLPNLFHYNHPSQRAERSEGGGGDSFIKGVSLAPEIYGDGGGLNCSVKF